MMVVEDYLDALAWAEGLGGLDALIARADANAKVLHDWIDRTPWIANLAVDRATWSNTSICLKIADAALSPQQQAEVAKAMVGLLEAEGVALDIGSYRDAPPGLRIWCGSTVETADVEALVPWLEWAFAEAKSSLAKAA
jgi:phosphoserine aminotransferase